MKHKNDVDRNNNSLCTRSLSKTEQTSRTIQRIAGVTSRAVTNRLRRCWREMDNITDELFIMHDFATMNQALSRYADGITGGTRTGMIVRRDVAFQVSNRRTYTTNHRHSDQYETTPTRNAVSVHHRSKFDINQAKEQANVRRVAPTQEAESIIPSASTRNQYQLELLFRNRNWAAMHSLR